MELRRIQPGDIVEADVKGRRFVALVAGREPGGLAVRPLCRNVSFRHVGARQVIGLWRRAGRRSGDRPGA